jgi:hypothetical protein
MLISLNPSFLRYTNSEYCSLGVCCTQVLKFLLFLLFSLMLLQCFALVRQLTYMHTYLQTSRLIYICYIDNLPNCSRQDIDKEISELKMSVNTRGRLVATEFLKQFI